MRDVLGIGALACVAAGSFAALSGQEDPGLFHDNRARDIVVAARIAMTGGPGGLARLQSLRLKGRSKFTGADGGPFEGSVEVRILLPDKYLRIDSGDFGRRLTGYAGTVPLNRIERADKLAGSEPSGADIVKASQFELARLMLGIATWESHEVHVVFYTRDAPADLPGRDDPLGVDAVSADGFAARVVFDSKSRMPARVLYRADRTVMTTALLDRKSSSGYRIPSRIVTSAGDRVVDELTFDDIAVNPKLTKADFAK